MSKLIPKPEKDQEIEFNEFVKCYTKGLTRIETCEKLGLDFKSQRYEILLDRFYSEIEQEQSSKSPLKIYAEYLANQRQVIKDLEKIKGYYEEDTDNKFKNGKTYVSACKAQSDIFDKIIATGQLIDLN